MTIKRHISHIKSKQIKNGKPKLPNVEDLIYGEIAINYAKDNETIAIKNSSDEIATFSSDTIRKKDERIIATALIDLNERKSDKGHTHTSNEINKMSGYTKPETTSAIVTGDTLNQAIGKLERGIDEKSGSGHTHKSNEIIEMSGYTKAETASAIQTGDTLNEAIGKLEKSADDAAYNIADLSGQSETIASALVKLNSNMPIDAYYDENGKEIVFKNNSGDILNRMTIDATDFIIDGMIDKVELQKEGDTTYLVITWNTDAGKETTKIDVGDIFEADNYFTKEELTGTTGYTTVTKANSANTASTAITVALSGVTDADDLKAIEALPNDIGFLKKTGENIWIIDTTAYSSATEVNTALSAKTDETAFTAHTESTSHMNATEKSNLDSLATNIEAISGITSTKVSNWDDAAISSHTHSNKTALDSITGGVGTMAYEDVSSYSSATEVNTALSKKSDTGHTHQSNEIVSMSGYTKAETASPIESGDTLNGAIGKLERGLDDATVNIDDLSGQSETISTALVNLNTNKVDAETFNAHSASTSHMNATEKTNLDSLATNIATISGITSTKVSDWDNAATNSHTHSNKSVLDGITGNVGTMAYEDVNSYSSATEVNEALNEKLNVSKFTKTTETISYALNELNSNMGGLKLMKISQADYDALPVKDPFTLYVISE